MNELITKLGADLAAKSAELDAILALEGDALTQELVEKGKAIGAEMQGIKTQIDNHKAKDTLAESQEAMKAYLKTSPVTHTHGTAGGATVVGTTPAGETTLTGNTFESTGTGLIGAKQWADISTVGYKEAYAKYLRCKGDLSRIGDTAMKALNEGIDDQGGYFVPTEMLNRLIQRTATPTRVSGLVTNITISKDSVTMPTAPYTADNLYTTGIRSTWTGEQPASSTVHRVTEPVFGQRKIDVFTNMMSMPITRDLLEDSVFDIMGYSNAKFNETIDLLKDNMAISGTGVGQPAGMLRNPNGTNEPATVVSGSASTLTADGLKNLKYSLPEQYDDNARFLFNKTSTMKVIDELKDGGSRYMWDSGYPGGITSSTPTGLLGYPFVLSGFMPNVGSNTYPILFGDFSAYCMVNRIGFSIQVLNEIYAETNQILLLGRLRFGGGLLEDWKVKIQKCST